MPGTAAAPAVLLTVIQAADMLGVSKHWVYRASADGRIPATKIGRLTRFRRSDLEAWIASQTNQAR